MEVPEWLSVQPLEEKELITLAQAAWQRLGLTPTNNKCQAWYDRFEERLAHYPVDQQRARAREVCDYLTRGDVEKGRVNMHAEDQWVKRLYLQSRSTIAPPVLRLQEPDETFGVRMEGEACIYCHSTDTTFMSQQVRSGDEPMNYYYTCRQCGQRWRK